MDKIYQVILQDEWNNLYHQGFYPSLAASLPSLNSFLESYGVKLEKKDLKTYAGSFSEVFDANIGDICASKYHMDEDSTEYEELSQLQIRGFIFEKNALLKEINAKNKKHKNNK